MEPNPILEEIRRVRDAMAAEAAFDVRKLIVQLQQRETEEAARGMKFAAPIKAVPIRQATGTVTPSRP